MKVLTRHFNIFLALAVLLGSTNGCQSDKQKNKTAAVRVHIESSSSDLTGATQQITVLRSEPVVVTINRDPILTEANIAAVRILNAQGGFALEIKFDENGTWLLEHYTAINPGRHLIIYGHWGEKPTDGRWLAAPLISRRISNGTLAFTPDCSRQEADLLVAGLKGEEKNSTPAFTK